MVHNGAAESFKDAVILPLGLDSLVHGSRIGAGGSAEYVCIPQVACVVRMPFGAVCIV